MTTPTPLLSLIETLKAQLEDAHLVLERTEAPGALALLRQQTMLTDLHEALTNKVEVVDLAFEGDFDPVADALEGGSTDYDRALADNKAALRAIAPVITQARAAGLVVHTPEIDEGPSAVLEETNNEALVEAQPHGI